MQVWTENVLGGGATNFLTGMGGLVQAVLGGYLGARAHLDRLQLAPRLPPDCTSLVLTGLQFHTAILNIQAAHT